MTRRITGFGGLCALFMIASSLNAQVTVRVVHSVAPITAVGASPNRAGYAHNAINALYLTLPGAGGTVFTPSAAPAAAFTPSGSNIQYFQAISTFGTPVNSWLSEANPSPPFDVEWGNEFSFGASLTSPMQFSLDDVSLTFDSNAPANRFDGPATLPSAYGDFAVGVLFGADNMAGGVGANADTFLFAGEASTTNVDALLIVPPGLSFVAGVDFPLPNINPQAEINAGLDALIAGGPTFIDANFAVAGQNVVPEPASLAVLVVGMIGLFGCVYWWRRMAAVVR